MLYWNFIHPAQSSCGPSSNRSFVSVGLGCQGIAGWFHLLNEDFGRRKHLRVTSQHNTLKWNLEIRKNSCGESVTEEHTESVCSSLTEHDTTVMICQVITKWQIPVFFNLTLTLLLRECVGVGALSLEVLFLVTMVIRMCTPNMWPPRVPLTTPPSSILLLSPDITLRWGSFAPDHQRDETVLHFFFPFVAEPGTSTAASSCTGLDFRSSSSDLNQI